MSEDDSGLHNLDEDFYLEVVEVNLRSRNEWWAGRDLNADNV